MEGTRSLVLRSAVHLEIFTVVWMVIEAALAIDAGVAARSVLLTSFGVDSVIELISAGILLRRLRLEETGIAAERAEGIERQAARLSALLLALVCLYVVVSSALGLAAHLRPEGSWLGLGVSIAAVFIMPWLAARKRRMASELGSRSLRADAAESLTCGYMAGTVLLGVAMNAVFGLWWLEYLAAFALLVWLVPETFEAAGAAVGQEQEEDDD